MRERAADGDLAGAVKIAARAHQELVAERTRHMLRMRSALREDFPAALDAYGPLGLARPDALEVLARAPNPGSAARLTLAQVTAVLWRAGRRGNLPGCLRTGQPYDEAPTGPPARTPPDHASPSATHPHP
jgi:hypothetical protein